MADVTVPMDDQALFDAALEPDAPPATTQDAPPQAASQDAKPSGDQPRDDQGRYAPKGESGQQQQDAPPATQEQQPGQQQPPPSQAEAIPAWRLREEAEGRRQAEANLQELQRQNAMLMGQLQTFTQKQQPRPDLYENPDGFVEHGVKTAVDPIRSEMSNLREYYSRKDAIREHGLETVTEAYKAFHQATRAGDPRVAGLVQRVLAGPDPFEDIVSWHKRERTLQTVGDNPGAWAEKHIIELAKDPTQRQRLLQALNGVGQQVPPGQAQPVVKLPPSLNRATASALPGNGAGSLDDAELYNFAIGR